ncbi:MAG: hypothetical protein WBG31_15365, partial [Marinomonas sp.]
TLIYAKVLLEEVCASAQSECALWRYSAKCLFIFSTDPPIQSTDAISKPKIKLSSCVNIHNPS